MSKTVTLEKAVEFTKEKARAIIETGEEHQPFLIALTPAGVSITSFRLNPQTKAMFKELAGGLLRLLNAYAYIFIFEAWVAQTEKDSRLARKILSGVKVSELPPDDRTEAVTILAAQNGRLRYNLLAKIRYTPEGKRYLDEWKEGEATAVGRMVLTEW